MWIVINGANSDKCASTLDNKPLTKSA